TLGGESAAIQLGAILGESAKTGINKLTFIFSDQLKSFGDWIEQLIAESTGKSGKGILPVVGEPAINSSSYSNDRLYVHISLNSDLPESELKIPYIHIILTDIYQLGGQFFLWEMVTAIASHVLNIHPFNQPNVESAKIVAREMVDAYIKNGKLPGGNAISPSAEKLSTFLANIVEGDYVSIQAYIAPTEETSQAIQDLRAAISNKYRIPTTTGYGPRFLHSTGQLHKGDQGNGHFIQFVSETNKDIPIPNNPGDNESSISFGILKVSQAIGDAKALIKNGRQVISFSVTENASDEIQSLAMALK
ncbi:MAG: glucose-6-phosphate isomerase, partial [Chloroflexota bacterium]